MGPRKTVEINGKRDISKDEVDKEFSALKRDVCNIIEASVPVDRQEGARRLAKNRINEVRILMLRWFGLEEEGEYNASQRQR
jgi:hypothetical protein